MTPELRAELTEVIREEIAPLIRQRNAAKDALGDLRAAMHRLDSALYLVGDENGDVGINCRRCGEPVAYYAPHNRSPYGPEVPHVSTIADLLTAGQTHLAAVHPEVTS